MPVRMKLDDEAEGKMIEDDVGGGGRGCCWSAKPREGLIDLVPRLVAKQIWQQASTHAREIVVHCRAANLTLCNTSPLQHNDSFTLEKFLQSNTNKLGCFRGSSCAKLLP